MEKEHGMRYRRFIAMVGTSTAVMFGLMYLNTYAFEHIFFSETRVWMAFTMGAAMATIMLSFMLGMYRDAKKNSLIFIGSSIVFLVALWLVRSQQTIDDIDYMKAMIPHHSIAIMTSERAHIRDARTRVLAEEILTAQRREIAEMRYLIAQIEEGGVRTAEAEVSR
jgi:predicted ATPase